MANSWEEYLREAEEDGFCVLRREMPVNPAWVYDEVRRNDGSLILAQIYPREGDGGKFFLCNDEAMLPVMMRDFWTSVGRRNIKCE